jgi:Domain of unknown function (DUF4328)
MAVVAPGSYPELAVRIVLLAGLVAFSLALAGGAISVPIWMHRAYRNLPALGVERLRWSPAWAAGAWFIPFANLVIPYLVVRELRSRSGGQPQPPSPGLWWATWLGANGLTVGIRLAYPLTQFSRLEGDVLDILAHVATMTAGVLLILIILHVTRRQEEKYTQQRGD